MLPCFSDTASSPYNTLPRPLEEWRTPTHASRSRPVTTCFTQLSLTFLNRVEHPVHCATKVPCTHSVRTHTGRVLFWVFFLSLFLRITGIGKGKTKIKNVISGIYTCWIAMLTQEEWKTRTWEKRTIITTTKRQEHGYLLSQDAYVCNVGA